jgi:hypothetical protein
MTVTRVRRVINKAKIETSDAQELVEGKAKELGTWFSAPDMALLLPHARRISWTCHSLVRRNVLEMRVNPRYANTGRFHQRNDFIQYKIKGGV